MKITIGVWIAAVLTVGVSMPIGDIPGLGQKARILYFHVPMWFVCI